MNVQINDDFCFLREVELEEASCDKSFELSVRLALAKLPGQSSTELRWLFSSTYIPVGELPVLVINRERSTGILEQLDCFRVLSVGLENSLPRFFSPP